MTKIDLHVTADNAEELAAAIAELSGKMAGQEAPVKETKKTEPDEKPARATKARASKATKKADPEPEEDDEDADGEESGSGIELKDLKAKAIKIAREDGKKYEVKQLLKKLGADSTDDLDEEKYQEFWDKLDDL
ncbi:hypothetical protein GCM10027051_31560 [Niabella terrae]